MNILLTNDDGDDAPGLLALAEVMAEFGAVNIVAPLHEQSAKSHALSMREAIRANRRGPRHWNVAGTPADCIYLALNHLLPERPDLVVSGINAGSNLATDVFYSGTVAGAREAACHGIPAVAASLWLRPNEPARWDLAQRYVREVVQRVMAGPHRPGTLWNLNVPNAEPLAGLRLASLGRRHYEALVDVRTDPRGRPYYWIGGDHEAFSGPNDSDGHLCEAGWATLTPLQLDHTDQAALAEARTRWT